LTVRELVETDVPLLARWLSDPRVIEWWYGLTQPHDEARVRQRYFVESEDWVTNAVVERDGRPVGFQEWYPLDRIEPTDQAKHDAIGFAVAGAYGMDQFVAPELHGQGLGTRQVRAVAAFLLDAIGATRVTSAPVVENLRSIHVLEQAGFTRVGVLPAFDDLDGELRDCLLLERRA
jgi:aminoglycoside 6'-N-acetyltransferase